MNDEDLVDFCISKCGCGYCNYMTQRRSQGDWPCVELICSDCRSRGEPTEAMCKFCRGLS